MCMGRDISGMSGVDCDRLSFGSKEGSKEGKKEGKKERRKDGRKKALLPSPHSTKQ